MSDSGVRTGLRRGSEYGAEAQAAQRKQMEVLERMGADASGAGAATVVRDKRGRKLTPEELQAKQARNKSAEDEQKGMEWGKGLVQASAARSKRDEDAHEAAKVCAVRTSFLRATRIHALDRSLSPFPELVCVC